ncbi:rhodanese-like domain-containing protein [Synechococcus sp. PCC 7336]|uniref:rhodanese-like domain-containing protein n=1 Tax=Synechococcus sp. PCC 7336 TaxID=195250 RepID=UPI000346E913|nr:rhodanese-like domain-containing protein [Synechococcus sp. PCC 7336]
MQSLPQVSIEEFCELVRAVEVGQLQLIDVREVQELAIANLNDLGFRNYPLSAYDQWSETILDELAPALPTYVMCHHGMRSAQMTAWLIQQGFTDVSNISGGIAAWSERIDPTLPQY